MVFVAVEAFCEGQSIRHPGYQCELYHRPRRDRWDRLSVSVTSPLPPFWLCIEQIPQKLLEGSTPEPEKEWVPGLGTCSIEL